MRVTLALSELKQKENKYTMSREDWVFPHAQMDIL